MFRSLLTLALSLVLVAEATAQTAPAAPSKTAAKATARTSRRAARKARRIALKTAPTTPRVNDGWPPLDDAQPAVASTAGVDAAGSHADVDLVYAGPGMPVHVRTSKEPVPYSVRPARRPAAATQQTTLGN